MGLDHCAAIQPHDMRMSGEGNTGVITELGGTGSLCSHETVHQERETLESLQSLDGTGSLCSHTAS